MFRVTQQTRGIATRRCRKLGAARPKIFFLRAIYFTRVDTIIIGARSAIELISAAKPPDREVYELTQMERARETRFLDSHALLSDYLCVYRVARSKGE